MPSIRRSLSSLPIRFHYVPLFASLWFCLLCGFASQERHVGHRLYDPPFGLFYDDDFDFSTPVDSSAYPGGLPQSELAIPEPGDQGPDSFPVLYTITWMLRLKKGRLMKLTEDTIENITIAPSAYWRLNLESKLASEAQERVPESQYEQRETTITVSTSKRGEPDFHKPFPNLDIDWTIIENKLRSWSNPKYKLKVTILLIYKEREQPTTKKAGRGATKKHAAALDKLIAQQNATGAGAVWQDVYRLFLCQSNSCTNQGFYCWRNDSRHYKLDNKVLEELVDCASEGIELKSHADMPERIREIIKAREMEDTQRKRGKALSEGCCSCRHNDTPPVRLDSGVELNLPMGIDEALKPYADWLCAQVSNVNWQESYWAAGIAAIERGYELQWFCNNKAAGIEILKACGVMPGIAEQFVSKIAKWVDEITD